MSVTGDSAAWAATYAAVGWHLLPLVGKPSGGVDKNPGARGAGYFDAAAKRAASDDPAAAVRDLCAQDLYRGFGITHPTLLGIDVDHGQRLGKDGEIVAKYGADTLAKWEAEHGQLPDTWRVTARTDADNGIRLFRWPDGEPEATLGAKDDIEIIRAGYRHAFVVGEHPGAHPHPITGRRDDGIAGAGHPVLFRPDGTPADITEIPAPGDLPEVPAQWLDHFRGACCGSTPSRRTGRQVADTAASSFWDAQPSGDVERISGVGLPDDVVVDRFRHVLLGLGWGEAAPGGADLAAFDHPDVTMSPSGHLRRGRDRLRLHVWAGSATLGEYPLPENGQDGYSLYDLLVVAHGGDVDAVTGFARTLGWLPQESGAAVAVTGGEPWPDPDPIVVGSVTPFPVDALPDGMADAVTEVARGVVVDPAIPATAFLGAAAGVLGARTEVKVTAQWSTHANLYLAVVAETGDAKTPGSTPAWGALRSVEDDVIAAATAAKREAEVMLPMLRRELKAAQDSGDLAVADMIVLQRRIESLESARRRDARVMVDDVTPERLAELLADNDGRLVAVNDEGALLRHLLGMYAADPNLDPFLKPWDGSPLSVDRKGGNGRDKTAIRVDRPLLTLVAAVQPATIATIGEPRHRNLIERGAVGRILIAWPQSTVGTRMMSGLDHHARFRHVDPWANRLLDLHRDGDAMLALTDDAREAFFDWHDDVEAQLPMGQAYADVRPSAVKIRGSVARIAGLFARLDGGIDVRPQHVERAIRLGDYYLDHAAAVVESWRGAPVDVARSLLAKVAAGRACPTVRDATRITRRPKTEVLAALDVLTEHGYTRPASLSRGYSPGRGDGIGTHSPGILWHPGIGGLR